MLKYVNKILKKNKYLSADERRFAQIRDFAIARLRSSSEVVA